MDNKVTRTKLRTGVVKPRRFAQDDEGVTGQELEVLLTSELAGEARQEKSEYTQKKGIKKPNPHNKIE